MKEDMAGFSLLRPLARARASFLFLMRELGGSVSDTPHAQWALGRNLGLTQDDYHAITRSLIDRRWAERVWTELFLTLKGWDQAQSLALVYPRWSGPPDSVMVLDKDEGD
jgi:hypothetical protein